MSDADKPEETKQEPITEAQSQGVIGQDAPEQLSEQEQEQQQAVKDFSRKEANGQLSMHVKISSPFKEYYEGQAFSVTAENATGPFDILPKHHNFISLLSPCEMIIRSVVKGEQKIQISGGLMHVKADQVVVFLDI